MNVRFSDRSPYTFRMESARTNRPTARDEHRATTDRPQLSVVIPMFNEAENVALVLTRIVESLLSQRRTFEIIVVNDGSRDATAERLDQFAAGEPRIKVIHLARNYGQTAAMMAGFWAARAPIIVPLDGDGQNEPDDVELLVDKLEGIDSPAVRAAERAMAAGAAPASAAEQRGAAGANRHAADGAPSHVPATPRSHETYDVVSGWRKDRKDHWLRTFVSRVANRIIGRVTGVKLHDYGCTLKAYRAHMVRDARLFGEMHRFIPVYTTMHGARITELVVRHHPRTAGTSKYGYGRIVKVALDLILVRMLQKYRTKPLHFFGKITQWTWIAAGLCIFFGVGRAIYAQEAWKAFWGKAPLVGLIFFLLGSFAIMLGLVAELAMRASYEYNQGRYWDEARRVNFGERESASGAESDPAPRRMSTEGLCIEEFQPIGNG